MVLLDVETQINRRPLSYVEDDVELPTFTPSTFLFQRTSQLPEEKTCRIEELDLLKRAKYLRNCKNSLWRRWQRESLTTLRERHNPDTQSGQISAKRWRCCNYKDRKLESWELATGDSKRNLSWEGRNHPRSSTQDSKGHA